MSLREQAGQAFSETARVFVALPLDQRSVEQTESIQTGVAARAARQGVRLRLTPKHQFHVTLAFLGEIATRRVPDVLDAMSEFSTAAVTFRLRVSGLVVFPSARRARVVGLGLEDSSGSLADAVKHLHAKLRSDGFSLEARAFRPHLTLGRLRNPAPVEWSGLAGSPLDVDYSCNSVAIYQSELGTNGARYRILHTLALG
jgi:2'-5' RNA ligase